MMDDEFNTMFPGDGLQVPSDDERDRADAVIAEWSARWDEKPFTIARHIQGCPTNRAYLRSKLRRWWRREK